MIWGRGTLSGSGFCLLCASQTFEAGLKGAGGDGAAVVAGRRAAAKSARSSSRLSLSSELIHRDIRKSSNILILIIMQTTAIYFLLLHNSRAGTTRSRCQFLPHVCPREEEPLLQLQAFEICPSDPGSYQQVFSTTDFTPRVQDQRSRIRSED